MSTSKGKEKEETENQHGALASGSRSGSGLESGTETGTGTATGLGLNLWDGLNELKNLVQFDANPSTSTSTSTSPALDFHPFSRFQPDLSIHQSGSSSSSSSSGSGSGSSARLISLKDRISQSIQRLRLSVEDFNHNHKRHPSHDRDSDSTLTRISTLLKQSSIHSGCISNILNSFDSRADSDPDSDSQREQEILFLPKTLDLGHLSHNLDSHPIPFQPDQVLHFLDGFSKTLTEISHSYRLESFTDHLIQSPLDPQLLQETTEHDNLSVQNTTIGGRILVMDLDFSLSIVSPGEAKSDDDEEVKEEQAKINRLQYHPKCKLKIDSTWDSNLQPDPSSNKAHHHRHGEAEDDLSILLQNKVNRLLNLIFFGREFVDEEASAKSKPITKSKMREMTKGTSVDESRFKAPEKAIRLLESLRKDLQFLAELDRLGALGIAENGENSSSFGKENPNSDSNPNPNPNGNGSGNVNGNPSQGQSQNQVQGIDLFKRMNVLCKKVESISQSERQEIKKKIKGQKDERMDVDGEEEQEQEESESWVLKSLLSKHGIPLINQTNPYLTFIYHWPFKHLASRLTLRNLKSALENDIDDDEEGEEGEEEEENNHPRSTQKKESIKRALKLRKSDLHYLRVAVEPTKFNPQQIRNASTEKSSGYCLQSNFENPSEVANHLEIDPLPIISSHSNLPDPVEQDIRLSYFIHLQPPVLLTRVTCREIQEVAKMGSPKINRWREINEANGRREFLKANRGVKSNPSASVEHRREDKEQKLLHLVGLQRNSRNHFNDFGVSLNFNFDLEPNHDQNHNQNQNQNQNQDQNQRGNQMDQTSNSHPDDQLFQVSKIPFQDLDQFYRIVEILKSNLRVGEFLREILEHREARERDEEEEGRQKKRKREEMEEVREGGESEAELDLEDLLRDEDQDQDQGEDQEEGAEEIDPEILTKRYQIRKETSRKQLPVNLSIRFPRMMDLKESTRPVSKAREGGKVYVPVSLEFGFLFSSHSDSWTLNAILTPDSTDLEWDLHVRLEKIHLCGSDPKHAQRRDEILKFGREDLRKCLESMSSRGQPVTSRDSKVNVSKDADSDPDPPRLIKLILYLEYFAKLKIKRYQKEIRQQTSIVSDESSKKVKTAQQGAEGEQVEEDQVMEGVETKDQVKDTTASKKRRKSSSSSSTSKPSLRRTSRGNPANSSASSGVGLVSNGNASVASRTRSRSASASASGSGRSRSNSPVKERKR